MMKITVMKNDFLEKIETVLRIVPKKSNNPIFTTIKLECLNTGIIITGTNGDESIVTLYNFDENSNVEKTGTVVFEAFLLPDIAKSFKSDLIILEQLDTVLTVKGKAKEFVKFALVDQTQFPDLNKSANKKLFTLDSDVLRQIEIQILHNASASTDYPILQGINFFSSKGKLNVVATDRNRVGMLETNIDYESELNLVPSVDSFKKIVKIFKGKDVEVGLIDERWIMLQSGSVICFLRLLEGNYPNVVRMIPDLETHNSFVFYKKELLEILHIFQKMSSSPGSKTSTRLTCSDGSIIVQPVSQNDSIADAEFEIELLSAAEDVKIVFSTLFLTEAVTAFNDDEKITLFYSAPLKPAIIKSTIDSNCLQLVLPLRMQ